MSTKIYNGYRLAEGTELLDFCDRARAALNPVRDRLDALEIRDRAGTIIDNRFLSALLPTPDKEHRPNRVWGLAAFEYLAEQRERNPALLGQDPHRFEFTVMRDPGTGDLLAITFCDRRDLDKVWKALPEVSEFGYWNNSDRPRGVSQKAWDARGEVWDRALGDRAPSECGLSFALRPGPMPDWDVISLEGATYATMPRESASARRDRASRLVKQAIRAHPELSASIDRTTADSALRGILNNDRLISEHVGDLAAEVAKALPTLNLTTLNTKFDELPVADESLTTKWSAAIDIIIEKVIASKRSSR